MSCCLQMAQHGTLQERIAHVSVLFVQSHHIFNLLFVHSYNLELIILIVILENA